MKIDIEEYSQGFIEPIKKKKSVKNKLKSETDLQLARVIFITPNSVHVHFDGEDYICSVKGNLKKELKQKKDRLSPGDLVFFDPKTLMIMAVQKRKTFLNRQNPSQKYQEQILAANIDILLITASALEPPINPYLIDLYVLSAKNLNLKPVILINKMDLLDLKKEDFNAIEQKNLIEKLKEQYEKLNIPFILVSAITRQGFLELEQIMKNQASVFSGASGVGKSSLINALEKTSLKISPVSAKNLKGTHTTTSSQLSKLRQGGWCVDTPGIQSLGFKNFDPIEIRNLFDELTSLKCQFSNCLHLDEKGCSIKEAIEKKEVSILRLESYYRLLKELNLSR